MNAYAAIKPEFEVEMTLDGEVLIPEPIRRAQGLVPGTRVVVGLNDRGEAVVLTRTQAKRLGERPEERGERIRRALDNLSGRYSTGQSTAELMEELRGDRGL